MENNASLVLSLACSQSSENGGDDDGGGGDDDSGDCDSDDGDGDDDGGDGDDYEGNLIIRVTVVMIFWRMKKSRKACSQRLPRTSKEAATLSLGELNGMESTKRLWTWDLVKGFRLG